MGSELERRAASVQLMARIKWLEAGQGLLRDGGLAAVKLEALTKLAELTTGSFYHHFGGMPAYLDSLAEFYGVDQVNENLAGIAGFEPRERLDRMGRIAANDRMRPLDAAMREWAETNEAAAAAVEAADAALLAFAASALVDLGHSRAEARIRAVMLLSIGTARVRSPWKLQRSAARRMIDIVVER